MDLESIRGVAWCEGDVMSDLEVDRDTFKGLDDKGQHLVLYDLIESRHVPETCTGLKTVWTHIKIQWWWVGAISVTIIGGAIWVIRSSLNG